MRKRTPSSASKQKAVDIEIARLRSLDIGALQAYWHSLFGKKPPSHLPKHLLFRMAAYQLQVNCFGGLDKETARFLDSLPLTCNAKDVSAALNQRNTRPKAGTVFAREWNGQMHHVMAADEGFIWNGKTYPSLTKAASAITGTHWNGPKFFGLRDKPKKTTGEAK